MLPSSLQERRPGDRKSPNLPVGGLQRAAGFSVGRSESTPTFRLGDLRSPTGRFCRRLQHQRPTSYEVGMCENLTRFIQLCYPE